MKKIDIDDIMAAAGRKGIQKEASALRVIIASNKFLQSNLLTKSEAMASMWKNGKLFIEVKNSAVASLVDSLAYELIKHLKKEFPDFYFEKVLIKFV